MEAPRNSVDDGYVPPYDLARVREVFDSVIELAVSQGTHAVMDVAVNAIGQMLAANPDLSLETVTAAIASVVKVYERELANKP